MPNWLQLCASGILFVVLAVAVIIVLSGVESAVAERESERRTWTLIIIFF